MVEVTGASAAQLKAAGRAQGIAHSHQLNEGWRYPVGAGAGWCGVGTLASPWGGAHIIRTQAARATQASPPPFPATPAPTGTPLPPKVGAHRRAQGIAPTMDEMAYQVHLP